MVSFINLIQGSSFLFALLLLWIIRLMASASFISSSIPGTIVDGALFHSDVNLNLNARPEHVFTANIGRITIHNYVMNSYVIKSTIFAPSRRILWAPILSLCRIATDFVPEGRLVSRKDMPRISAFRRNALCCQIS